MYKQTHFNTSLFLDRVKTSLSLTDIRGVKNRMGGRVHLYSGLNCLISLKGMHGRGERHENYVVVQVPTGLIKWNAPIFCVHLPCEKNDRLDCLKFPCCSLVKAQGCSEYRCMSFVPWASSLQNIGKLVSKLKASLFVWPILKMTLHSPLHGISSYSWSLPT